MILRSIFANVFTKVLRRFLLRFSKISLMLLRRCMFTKVLLRSFPDGFSEGIPKGCQCTYVAKCQCRSMNVPVGACRFGGDEARGY